MGQLKVLKAGPMCSIQDLGRTGYSFYAIPKSGAMDCRSAKLANELLDNPVNSALIECSGFGLELEFLSDAFISLTGGDPSWQLDEQSISINQSFPVKKGQVLLGGKINHGFRAYIGIRGTLNVNKVWGSSSFYSHAQIGGHKGQYLKSGDILSWKENNLTFHEKKKKPKAFYEKIKLHKGPEFEYLNEPSKNLLQKASFEISADSNRMGVRLNGSKLICLPDKLEHSVPVFPGIIQLPPSGQPFVLLQDCQSTGGYPRIAYIDSEHLDYFNQIAIGRLCKFVI